MREEDRQANHRQAVSRIMRLDRQRRRYDRDKLTATCVTCGQRSAVHDRVRCLVCLDKQRDSARVRRARGRQP